VTMVARLFLGMLDASGVTMGQVMAALKASQAETGHAVKAFRSERTAPSGAHLNQERARQIAFPPSLGYVAGNVVDDRLVLTAMCLDQRLLWYGNRPDTATLVVKKVGGKLPDAMRNALLGQDATVLVDHPALRGSGCVIRGVHGNASAVQLTVDTEWVDIPHV